MQNLTRRDFLLSGVATVAAISLSGCASVSEGVRKATDGAKNYFDETASAMKSINSRANGWTGKAVETFIDPAPPKGWSEATMNMVIRGPKEEDGFLTVPAGTRILNTAIDGRSTSVIPGSGPAENGVLVMGWDECGNPALWVRELLRDDGRGWMDRLAVKMAVLREEAEKMGFFYELSDKPTIYDANLRENVSWKTVFGRNSYPNSTVELKIEPGLSREQALANGKCKKAAVVEEKVPEQPVEWTYKKQDEAAKQRAIDALKEKQANGEMNPPYVEKPVEAPKPVSPPKATTSAPAAKKPTTKPKAQPTVKKSANTNSTTGNNKPSGAQGCDDCVTERTVVEKTFGPNGEVVSTKETKEVISRKPKTPDVKPATATPPAPTPNPAASQAPAATPTPAPTTPTPEPSRPATTTTTPAAVEKGATSAVNLGRRYAFNKLVGMALKVLTV